MRASALGLATVIVAVVTYGCSDEEVPSGDSPWGTGGDTDSADDGATSDDGGQTPSPTDTSTSSVTDGATGGGSTGGSTSTPGGSGTETSNDGSTTGSSSTQTDDTSSSESGGVVLDVGPPDVGDGLECGESNWVVTPVPSNALLVLDASGSMVNVALYWDHDDDPGTEDISRWHSLHNVVELIVGTFDYTLNLGLVMFPNPGEPVDCVVGDEPQVPVTPLGGDLIMDALPPKDAYDELWGNPTPTEYAMDTALEHMLTLDPAVHRAMVLVSDGVVSEPCFNTHAETLAVIDEAYQTHGIPTYVVGVRITSSWEDGYNEWAAAGGVPAAGANDFYDVTNEIELQDALQEIAAMEVSCVAPLDPPPPNPNMVQVRLDGDIVFPASDCATDDGWVYVNPAGPYDAIELCGSHCDEFKVTGGEVLAMYGCPPEG